MRCFPGTASTSSLSTNPCHDSKSAWLPELAVQRSLCILVSVLDKARTATQSRPVAGSGFVSSLD